ncbi:MAG TPA: AAA family ATPase [Thiopseudomonas sp.]|nr:AAA family ATPase [Thiopseudomonas sp.]
MNKDNMSHLHADDDYLDYYQFEHDPFLARGASFKFFAARRRPVLVELHHIARYSKLMLVVTGPQGSGKTVLRQALVASSKDPVKSIVVSVSDRADAASMLSQVSSGLSLPDSEIADVLKHIEQLTLMGQEIYLIVDNAERLDESALLFLQRIAQGINDASARVFIFSDSSISPLLAKVADNTDLHHIVALEPWDEQETEAYIEQRLSVAGQPLDVFTREQLSSIYSQSQGWPGQINHIAKALLVEQMDFAVSRKKQATPLPYKHIGLLAVLITGLFFTWFMLSPESPDGGETLSELGSPAASVAGKVERPLELNAEPVMRAPLAQAVSTEDEDGVLLPDEREQTSAEMQSLQPIVSAPVPISTPPAQRKVVVEQPTAVASKAAAPVRNVQTPAAVQNKAPVASTGLSGGAGHNQWYKQQAPSRYTLQVFGTRSEATAQNLVKQNSAQYHYFRKEHQGQALFVVTYGNFINRAAAETAINSLPDKIRSDKPWPRPISSIQQELR